MMMDYSEFYWHTSVMGYQWEKAKVVMPIASTSGKKSFSNTNALIEIRLGAWPPFPHPQYAPMRQYAPMQRYPALFRTFAALDASEEAILEFAQKFGWLQGAYSVVPMNGEESKGEPVDLWTEQIAAMKCAVSMWEMLQNRDYAGLQKFIEWRDYEGYFFKGAPNVEGRLIGFPSSSALVPEGDARLPAVFQIAFMVSQRLYPGVRLELAFDLPNGLPELRQIPNDLLACMWLQLATTINENKSHRQCPGCDNWFEIGGRGGRTDKQYCGDACRMRVNRETQERAEARALEKSKKARSKKKKGK